MSKPVQDTEPLASTPLQSKDRRGFPERYYPAALALFVAVFALYVATLAPGLMPGDTGDMVQAAATLREAHPPGYPLYSMIGKLFVALPIGDIPYRVNLMAAFLGGAAVAFTFLALILLTRHALASLAGSLLFAFNYLFWTYFVLAETFCLNNFFLAFTAFLALLWRERHRQDPGSLVDRRMLVLLAFLAGISMGNHHTMVLTFPGLLLFVALVDRNTLRPARLAGLFAWFGLGLVLPYLYLMTAAMAHPYHHWEDASTLRGLLRLFFRVKYGTFQLAPGEGSKITPMSQASSYFGALTTQYLWAGFVFGILGAIASIRRDRPFLVYSGGAFLLGAIFILKANIDPKPTAYDAATLERFYQLPNFYFMLWAGIGLAALARAMEAAWPGPLARPAGKVALAFAILLTPGALFAHNYPKANLRGNMLYPRFVNNIIDTLPPDAILLAWSDTVGMGTDYLQDVERRRPDVSLILMGIVGSEPYRTTVRLKYPHLIWPGKVKGTPFGLGKFIHDNLPKHRIFVDGLPIKISFPVTRYGLVYEIRPAGAKPTVDEVMKINEDLWKRYDLRQVDTTLYPANSMCYSVVVFYYLFQRFSLATEYNYFGRHEDALRHLKACLTMDQYGYVAKSPPWHRQMAHAYLGLKQTKRAQEHLEKVLKQAPEETETYRLLSWVHEDLGNKAEAKRFEEEWRKRKKVDDERKRREEAAADKKAKERAAQAAAREEKNAKPKR